MPPITQKDIAREVGVSQTIVSDVLQNRPRGRVSPETRQRILDTAQRLGYRPNLTARALRMRRSGQIAYIITRSDMHQHYTLGEAALTGLAEALAEKEYQLRLRVVATQEEAQEALAEMFASRECDGAVIRVLEEQRWNWSALRHLGRGVLFLGHCSDDSLSSLAFDTQQMVEKALGLLASRGHRCVGLLNVDDAVDYYRLVREAWQGTAGSLGIASAQRYMGVAVEKEQADAVVQRWFPEGSDNDDDAPTAVVCLKCRAAVGVATALDRMGRRIGEDFDLVVFGDPVFGEGGTSWMYAPGTWYFEHDQEEIGRRAAQAITRLLEDGSSPECIRVLPELKQK